MAKTVYVSSTYADLIDHRAAVGDVLRRMRYDAIGMEDYVARDVRVVDECLRDVEACDIYLGIFAWRYGHVPSEDNPHGWSITELEYRHAKELGKSRLLFVLDSNALWPDDLRDSHTGDGDGGHRARELRDVVNRDRMVGRFTDAHDLAITVAASLHLNESDARMQHLSTDLASASSLTMMSSDEPEIVANVRQAIADNVNIDVIKVNLGEGRSWWSTRLLLLAALCADYTEVRQLLFEANDDQFIGMCTPSQARRALGRYFPDVETAYRASVPLPREASFDPVDDVWTIVNRFSAEMDALGGEQDVKQWVAPHVVLNWPGIDRSTTQVGDSGFTPALLETVVARQEPYIVLVREGVVQKVVDRSALATRMALATT